MMRANSVAFVILLLTQVAEGEGVTVDIAEWSAVGTGVTESGWAVNGVGRYVDGGAQFNSRNDYAISPVFSPVITQLVMQVKSSSPGVTSIMTITPLMSGVGASAYKVSATDSPKYVRQVFAWPCEAGVRQIRFQNKGTFNATWGIASLEIHLGGVAPPTCLRTSAAHRDAISVGWDGDPGAAGHEVVVGRVERTPPRFEEISAWDFTSLTNASGNTRNLAALNPPASLANVEGEGLCLAAHSGGHLQIGKSEVAGVLSLPVPTGADELTCLLSAWKYEKDSGSEMPLSVVAADGETNALPSLALSAAAREFQIDVPNDAVRLLLRSTASRRVRVAHVALVADYEPAMVSTNWCKRFLTTRDHRAVGGLAPGEWTWAVRSSSRAGEWSGWVESPQIFLDGAWPTYCPPGFILTVR